MASPKQSRAVRGGKGGQRGIIALRPGVVRGRGTAREGHRPSCPACPTPHSVPCTEGSPGPACALGGRHRGGGVRSPCVIAKSEGRKRVGMAGIVGVVGGGVER